MMCAVLRRRSLLPCRRGQACEGGQFFQIPRRREPVFLIWIPACAGMTFEVIRQAVDMNLQNLTHITYLNFLQQQRQKKISP
jgi:hypothetical protein